MVFIILSGVEFVVVFVLLVLLNIEVILGMFLINLFVVCRSVVVFVGEMSGKVDGIYSRLFLLIFGRNLLFI